MMGIIYNKKKRSLEKDSSQMLSSKSPNFLQTWSQSDDIYQDIFNNVPASIFLLDNRGIIINVNPYHLTKVAGNRATLDDYIGKDIITHPTIINAGLTEAIKSIYKGKCVDLKDVYFSTTTYGSSGYFNIKGVPIMRNSKVVGSIIMKEDITDRKLVENALREIIEFNSALLDFSPNPILVINPDRSVRYVNQSLMEATGYSEGELVGTKPPYPWWTAKIKRKSKKDSINYVNVESQNKEELFQRKDGERFWVKINSVPVEQTGNLKYYIANWVDISEQKELRESLQRYVKDVIEAQEKERKQIARELHDETLQSLNYLHREISTFSSNEELSEGSASKLRELCGEMDRIITETRRFTHKLRPDVLDYLGLVPALKSLVRDLNDCSQETVGRFSVVGTEKRISSDVELALFRVAQEAINNVRKHAKAKEATIRVKFYVHKVVVSVVDDGVGFDYRQVMNNESDEVKLGLIGMNERLHLIHGKLAIKTRPGKGTVVTAEVPLQEH